MVFLHCRTSRHNSQVEKIELEIFGIPKPQGSKRHVGRGRLIEAAGPALTVWRKQIAEEANLATCQKIIGPVEVEAVFFLPRPQSVSKKKRPLPIKPPDLDKLARALLDGIGQAGNIWEDDSQVIRLTASKFYADDRQPGASVTIKSLS